MGIGNADSSTRQGRCCDVDRTGDGQIHDDIGNVHAIGVNLRGARTNDVHSYTGCGNGAAIPEEIHGGLNRCDGSVGGRDVDRNPVQNGECVTSWHGCKQQQVELQLLADGVESHVWSLPTNGGPYLHSKWSGGGMAGGGSTKTIVTDIFTGDQSCAAGGSLGNKDGSWNAVDFPVVKAQSNNCSAEWRRLRQRGGNCGRRLRKIDSSGICRERDCW